MCCFLATAFIVSCDDDTEEFVLDTNQNSEIMLSPASISLEVTGENQDDLAERFSWNAASFDLPIQVTYQVEMDAQGGDFSAPIVLGATGDTNLAFTYGELNDLLLANGANAGVAENYDIRVRTVTSDPAIDSSVSNLVSATITPFAAYLFTDLYLVGNATEADWNNNNNNQAIFRDANDENVYYYTGRFVANEFKLLTDLGNWQPQYGTSGNAVGLNDGNAGGDPGTFVIPATGYYDFTIDISGVTNDDTGSSSFTLVENTAAASAPTYGSIGFIGSATPGGWDADTDMVQSSFDPHKWSARDVTIVPGEIKFRANDAWDDNWGATSEWSGQASLGSPDNMPIAAGTYNIFFDDITGRYAFIPVED